MAKLLDRLAAAFVAVGFISATCFVLWVLIQIIKENAWFGVASSIFVGFIWGFDRLTSLSHYTNASKSSRQKKIKKVK